MRPLLLCLHSFLILVFFSCNKKNAPDCFSTNGKDVSQIRETGVFSKIELNDDLDLTLFSGAEYKVEVIGGENIIDKIQTSVESGTLIINNKNRCNFVRGYKRRLSVNITLPYLYKISNNAVGTIRFDENYKQDSVLNVNAESSGDTYINGSFGILYTSSNGNGDMYLNGTAKRLNVYTRGTNYTHAENFVVSADILISGYSLGDTYLNLNSNNTLNYVIGKDGNIYYSGTPALINGSTDDAAKGKLIHQD